MKIINKIKIYAWPIIGILAPLATRADDDVANINKLNPTFGNIYDLSQSITDRIPTFLGGLAFLAILYSGAIYITSFGDATKMEQAKKNLTWTVIGIIAAAAVYGIITAILWITTATALTP